jgi:GTP-binding protein Era
MAKDSIKSGFAVLVGRSNVGKSSLLNALVGSKIAITTPKPQTTRQTIQGIVHDDRGQIVFVDTPGIFHKAKDVLTKKLNQRVKEAVKEIDVLIYVVDPTRPIGPEERELLGMIDIIQKPKLMVINKTDIKYLPYIEEYRVLKRNFVQTIELSAKEGKNIKGLINEIFELLPEGVEYYPKHQLTNIENKEWFAELIREKLFIQLHQELPYSIHVVVDKLEEKEDNMIYIKARIITDRDRHKGMVVGKGGQMVKSIGQSARRELEAVTGKKIYLDLEVEVQEHWKETF